MKSSNDVLFSRLFFRNQPLGEHVEGFSYLLPLLCADLGSAHPVQNAKKHRLPNQSNGRKSMHRKRLQSSRPAASIVPRYNAPSCGKLKTSREIIR